MPRSKQEHPILAWLGGKEGSIFGNKDFILVRGEKEELELISELEVDLPRQLGTRPKIQELRTSLKARL